MGIVDHGKEYLQNSENAVCALFEAIKREEQHLDQIKIQLQDRIDSHMQNYDQIKHLWSFKGLAQNELITAQAYYNRIANISQLSRSALCSAVLQIAKQGIAFVFKKDKPPEQGPQIDGQYVTTIIWHSRNQAMHFEDEDWNKWTKKCFEQLEKTKGDKYSLEKNKRKSLASQVVRELLEWSSYEDYEKTMKYIFSTLSIKQVG